MRRNKMNANQQLVCGSKPFCLCVGGPNEWDECCCIFCRGDRCDDCDAKAILIDIETGEEVNL
jgi:hypothetical protein